MSLKYIVRPPNIVTTPRLLSIMFKSKIRKDLNPTERNRSSYFFTYYPELKNRNFFSTPIDNDHYLVARDFQYATKFHQRERIRSLGFKVPDSFLHPGGMKNGNRYIIRPLRHTQGNGYVVSDDPKELKHGMYASEIFPKTHEYRLILIKGIPTVLLKKEFSGEKKAESAWNHSTGEATFITINTEVSNLKVNTDLFKHIGKPEVQANLSCFDIIAMDIMYNKKRREYSICEFNLCPSLSIENNLERIKEVWTTT